LHPERPAFVQGFWHDDEERQQRQVAKHQEKLRTGAARPADLALGPADQGKRDHHHDVVDDVPIRIDDRQRHRRHRQRDPAGANGEEQAFALAVRDRRLGEFLGLLPDLGASSGCAPGNADIGRFHQCAQDLRPQTKCIGSCIRPQLPGVSMVSRAAFSNAVCGRRICALAAEKLKGDALDVRP
jgi:hypothetical protein